MAHLHKKMKSGRPYYYIREIQRVNGKPTVVNQVYLGSPERILELFTTDQKGTLTSLSSREFGALFIFNEIDKEVGFTEIVDSVVPAKGNEERPTVGEYCYYAVLNRIIEPLSKLRLPEWYKKTDIQHIRPVAIERLNSKAFWDKWDKVDEGSVKEISQRFFRKVREIVPVSADCFLFDTTNYYTYLSSKTESDLAVRGKNKDGKHHLRQLGLALLVERSWNIPVYYRLYPGNRHDSKVLHESIEELFREICSWGKTKERLTVVFDKGMNSEDNVEYIDENQRVHFITSYSPFFAEDLAGKDLKHFSPLSIPKNQDLRERGEEGEQILAYRNTGQYWGKDRAVVVTYNPRTHRKKKMDFEQKLNSVREELLLYRRNYREQRPHWKDEESIRERYYRLCEDLHIGSQYYEISFASGEMSFRQHQYQIKIAMDRFGKNIIITDNIDWSTEEIYLAYNERSKIERQFRKSKSPFSIAVTPQYHWTDSKIRLHILTCVVAMVYFSIFRNKLKTAGINLSAEDVLKELRELRTALYMAKGSKKLNRRLEDLTKTQSEVLKIFGYAVKDGWILQNSKL
ncbi:MAG TPA: IS1634 family transposase [Thermodesulfovibrionales bacterium]|nr:IS1634 family transposase [Thermodesulfovibrionales bacterium]